MKSPIKDDLLDELLKEYTNPSDLLGLDGLFTELKKRLINRVAGGSRTSR
jgi:putative transposase